jgi:hypothetical protein
VEVVFQIKLATNMNLTYEDHKRQHSAYFNEESLCHLLFEAQTHTLGDPERSFERFSKFTLL